jgi:antitoxin component YwqK of YwqJK toxin-antitoxin module
MFGESALVLKNQQPNWKIEVAETYPSGSPWCVEFYAPIPRSEKLEKVKEKLFTPTGSLAEERDFKNGVRDGVTIAYYPSEKIETIALYQDGLLEGILRTFDEQGVLRDKYSYHQGHLDGPYELFSSKGTLIETGAYVRGSKEGEVVSYGVDGEMVKKESYFEGLLHGELSEYYPNGNLSGVWHYYHGLLHGDSQTIAVTKYSPQRKVVEEQDFRMGQPWGLHKKYKEGVLVSEETISVITPLVIKDEPIAANVEIKEIAAEPPSTNPKTIKDGKYETFYSNGSKRSVIEYKNGVLHGKKMLWDSDGDILEEANYVEGNLEGRYRRRELDGSDRLSHYKNNQLHGLFEVTHPPHDFFGKLKALECHYDEGLLEGDLIDYNIAGTKVAQIPYKQGKREGNALYFNEKGILSRSVHFQEDRLHGKMEEYYPNGALRSVVLFHEGVKEGPEVHYFDHGAIRSVTHYRQGLLDGESKEWNSHGQLIYEGHFARGERKGLFRRYDEKGHVIKERSYE